MQLQKISLNDCCDFFQNWSDKEEIFRKSKILKNCGIIVEEDFSRAAKFRRKELEKLVKEIKILERFHFADP